jgi:hypothetical protein
MLIFFLVSDSPQEYSIPINDNVINFLINVNIQIVRISANYLFPKYFRTIKNPLLSVIYRGFKWSRRDYVSKNLTYLSFNTILTGLLDTTEFSLILLLTSKNE